MAAESGPSAADFTARGWDECLGVLDRLEAALGAPDREADPCLATGAGWIAEEALATGLLCFLLFPDEPLTALRRAACTSGDSDSIACLTGAFAGARLGAGAWPRSGPPVSNTATSCWHWGRPGMRENPTVTETVTGREAVLRAAGLPAVDLNAVVAEQDDPLVFATVSGAHLYGFPSRDSDVDLRGAHLLPAAALLGLHEPDETRTRMWDEGRTELDLVSHDLRKFARLLLRRNGYVLEQLLSPWWCTPLPCTTS